MSHVCRYAGRHDLCPYLEYFFEYRWNVAYYWPMSSYVIRLNYKERYSEILMCEDIYKNLKGDQVKRDIQSVIPVADLANIVYGYWNCDFNESFRYIPDHCVSNQDMLAKIESMLTYHRDRAAYASVPVSAAHFSSLCLSSSTRQRKRFPTGSPPTPFTSKSNPNRPKPSNSYHPKNCSKH